ncbi:hypothetical protein ACLESD_35210 [Pyxidicoccus sp. 3LFB2]
MSKILRSLLVATAFLTLAPTAALALPPDCDEACDFEYSSCTQLCAMGRYVTTCGDYGICVGARDEPSESSASVSQDEAQQAESSNVCGEESQPAAAES